MEKALLIITILISNILYSQSTCTVLTEKIYDKVEGKSYLKIKTAISVISEDEKQGFVLGGYSFKKNRYVLSFNIVGISNCVDKTDFIRLLFTDGTKLKVFNSTSFSCDSEFTIYMGGVFGNKKVKKTLQNKELETIRFVTNNGVGEFEINETKRAIIKENLKCLFETEL